MGGWSNYGVDDIEWDGRIIAKHPTRDFHLTPKGYVDTTISGSLVWGNITGAFSNQTDAFTLIDEVKEANLTKVEDSLTITGAGDLLVGQGGDLTINRVFTLNNSGINHDGLFNFEANEHINWTNAFSNLQTSGNITTTGGDVNVTSGSINVSTPGEKMDFDSIVSLYHPTGTSRFTMESDGSFIYVIDRTNAGKNYSFLWYHNAADAGGSQIMRLWDSGKLNIGSSAGVPTDNLQVQGTALITGDLKSTGTISGAQVFSSGGFTGTGSYTSFVVSGGIIISAS